MNPESQEVDQMEDKPRQYIPRITLGSGTRITPKLVPDGKGGYDLPELIKKVISADQASNRGKCYWQNAPPSRRARIIRDVKI